MAEFRLSPAAESDLDGIFDYTVHNWGLDQAKRYTDDIRDACQRLADAPHRAQRCDHIRTGYRRRTAGKHIIYFKQTPYGIVIVRILHHKMDTQSRL
jgi:toxin ParE1/3/4